MMKNKEFEFDTLQLYAKKNKAEEIIHYYNLLKWELTDKSDNSTYEDIVDLSFVRPHKINNKDELQLLQVYLEERLNAQAKNEKNKHAKITASALFFGVLGFLFLIFGALNIMNILQTINIVVSYIFLGIGTILIIIGLIAGPQINKNEKSYYKLNKDRIENEIELICQKILHLTGGKDEKDS